MLPGIDHGVVIDLDRQSPKTSVLYSAVWWARVFTPRASDWMGFVFILKTAQADPSSPELEMLPGKKQSSWKHSNSVTPTQSAFATTVERVSLVLEISGEKPACQYTVDP